MSQYDALDWDAYYHWYRSCRVLGRQPTPTIVDNLTMIIAQAQCAVFHAERMGDIEAMDLDEFVQDISGALEGLSSSERRMERLRNAYEDAVGRKIRF